MRYFDINRVEVCVKMFETNKKMTEQPNLFESGAPAEIDRILLFALGEFQSRGKVLAERPLALDRLRGAFKRSAEKFQAEELTDETIAEALERLGAKVVRRPSFVAKHPYHITVRAELSELSKAFYKEITDED